MTFSARPIVGAAALRARVAASYVLAVACAALLVGCSGPKGVVLRKTPKNVLATKLNIMSRGGPKPTPRTMQILRRYDLVDQLKDEPRGLLSELGRRNEQRPSAEIVYAMAELAYIAGKKAEDRDEQLALDMYGASVAHAYLYLFDERYRDVRNPYDPQYRGASELYNQALEGSLRFLRKRDLLRPGCRHTIRIAGKRIEMTVVVRGNTWRPEDFDHFEFVSDYEIQGLRNHYQTYGLGVPMIAVRHKKTDPNSVTEQFYPPDVSFPVTMFLRLVGEGPRLRAVLELHDPLASTDIRVGDRLVPLQSDPTTPLAYFLNNPEFQDYDLATAGLLNPGASDAPKGLFMLEPYQPGKIPVLMVHGLWSSPVTWLEMFNDLRNSPRIRDRYQFWFYLYPTGQPFWTSAAQLRADLARMRSVIDPEHREPALDQMVLVAHSMGGLVAKLQTLDSGDDYWNLVSSRPFTSLKASPHIREKLARTFFFRANPSISRVVTIGTPHRGSEFANKLTRWLASKLIKQPDSLTAAYRQLRRDNPGALREESLIEIPTSLDSLAPEAPIFPVMLASYRPSWVKYHNIVGVEKEPSFLSKLSGRGDSVVNYESAHLEGIASELTVASDHVNLHRHPRSVLEVYRILLEHLSDVDRRPIAGAGVRRLPPDARPRAYDPSYRPGR